MYRLVRKTRKGLQIGLNSMSYEEAILKQKELSKLGLKVKVESEEKLFK